MRGPLDAASNVLARLRRQIEAQLPNWSLVPVVTGRVMLAGPADAKPELRRMVVAAMGLSTWMRRL